MSQYATIPDLYLYAIPEEARGSLTDEVLTAALVSASADVDGYLEGRFGSGSMPLVSWTAQISEWTCWIAAYKLLTGPRGMGAASPDYQILRDRYQDALRLLGRAQRQDYPLPGVTARGAMGQTGLRPVVLSNRPRGW